MNYILSYDNDDGPSPIYISLDLGNKNGLLLQEFVMPILYVDVDARVYVIIYNIF